MITFPSEVLDFLYHLQLEQHRPAWMLVSSGGKILDRGGHLERYGFLPDGTTVDEVCPWLIGLLPLRGDRLELSLVEVDDHTAFQPYLLPHGDGHTLVVVLDMSSEFVLQRAAQQVINEDELIGGRPGPHPPGLLDGLVSELGFLLMLRDPSGGFTVTGTPPSWWRGKQETCTLHELIEAFPLVESFLSEAAEVWDEGSDAAFSEVWEQRDGTALMASAHRVGTQCLLLVRSPGPLYDELSQLVQELHGS